jgi:MFS family permease
MVINVKSSRVINATPFFYGWVILMAGTIGIIMMGPSQTFTISVFTDYFIADLGISRANLSLIYGLATLGGSFLLPLTGRLVDRYGPRRTTPFIVLALGGAAMAMGLVQQVLALFMVLLALRFLGFGSLQLVSNNLIAQWFIHKRGRVMGLAGLSLSIGLIIFPGLSETLINQFGWRWAMIWLGGLVWVVMLPVSLLFFRDRPELYGLCPDGAPSPPAISSARDEGQPGSEVNWSLAEARCTSIFWLFAAGLTTLTMLLAGLVFHQISLFAARGLSREAAIASFNAVAIFSVIGNLGVGWLLDRVSARLLLALTLFLAAVMIIILMVMTSPTQAMLYGALNGLVSGSFRVMDGTVWAKYFGRRYLGSIRGAVMIGVVGGTALGPYPLGLSLDYFGSYAPALWSLLLLPVVIGLAALLVKRPARPAP